MTVLPGFHEHFRDILNSGQLTLPELRPGSLAAYKPAPTSGLSKTCPHQSLIDSTPCVDLLELKSCNLCCLPGYERMTGGCQASRKTEESPTSSEVGDYMSTESSSTWSTSGFHSSKNVDSSATTLRNYGNSATQPIDFESRYADTGMICDRSNIISSLPSSDTDPSWFNSRSPIVQRIMTSVSHLSREELLAEFWKVKSDCRHYGAQPGKTNKHDASEAKSLELGTRKQRQKVRELFRRRRHLVYQRDLHLMTCERARLLAESDDLYSIYRTSGGNDVYAFHGTKAVSAAKLPSKDDQLMANIYMQALSAIVVQSEHEGRIKAERLAAELEKNLKRMGRYEMIEGC